MQQLHWRSKKSRLWVKVQRSCSKGRRKVHHRNVCELNSFNIKYFPLGGHKFEAVADLGHGSNFDMVRGVKTFYL